MNYAAGNALFQAAEVFAAERFRLFKHEVQDAGFVALKVVSLVTVTAIIRSPNQ